MLLAALTLVCSVTFAQTTKTWAGTESTALPEVIGSDLTLTWIEGSADQGPSFDGTKKAASMKSGNKLTIAGADANVTISEIVFTFDNSSDPGLSASVGSISSNYTANTTTWTGESQSITFTASGKRLIKSIAVTYTGSAAPVVKTPVLSITKVDNFGDTYDMDATDQKTLVVYYQNTGNGKAENAKLTLYVDNVENKVVEIGTINAGVTDGWKNISYELTKIEAGSHSVVLSLSADGVEAVNTDAKTVTFTKAVPQPAFSISANNVTVPHNAASYDVVATLTETNSVAASNVKVELRKNITDVIATQTVESLAAGGNTQVTLSVAKEFFETGTKTYYLYVNDTYLSSVEITFEAAPIVEVKDIAVTGFSGSIDQALESNSISVTLENKGNVQIDAATITLKAGETVLGTGSLFAPIKVKEGDEEGKGFSNVTISKEVAQALTPGELTVTATAFVDGEASDKLTDNTFIGTIQVKAAPAPEATYTVTAANVNVEYGAPSFQIAAEVTNTSADVDATNVPVKLLKGITEVETKNIESLAHGAKTNVFFTITATEEAPFTPGTNATYFVQVDNKVQAEVTVTFKEQPVVPVKDIAITGIQGTIDQSQESNIVTVLVENKGNVQIDAATFTLKAGEITLGTGSLASPLKVKGGDSEGTGYCSIIVSKAVAETLTAGDLAVTATVEVEGEDADKLADNTFNGTITVAAAPAPQATFTVTANDVTVKYGAPNFQIVAQVTNTSDIDATDVEVKLYKGATVKETKIIATFAKKTVENVFFTIDAADFAEPGKTATYHVMVGTAMAEVSVTFEQQPVAEVKDLAITQVSASPIDLNVDSNQKFITVAVENNGNVDITDARIVVTATINSEEVVLARDVISAKAGNDGNTGMKTVTLNTADLTVGELELTVAVEVEGDATPADNTVKKTIVVIDTTETDGIEAIKAQLNGKNAQIFTIKGEKVSNITKAGLYIVNGRKVVVK